MPLPDDLYSDDTNYRIRVCLDVAANPNALLVEGTVQKPCDGCRDALWVHENQALPDPNDGTKIDGDLNLCVTCVFSVLANTPGDDPLRWL